MHRIETLQDYYADPFVYDRIREYCGVSVDRPPTCLYLAAMTPSDGPFDTWDRAPRYPVEALNGLMAAGADIARSTWDRSNLLIHLDVDYQNADFPGEPYHHPAEVFFKLEPVYRTAHHVLRRFGLPLLPLMTGRGYHFTGRVPLESDAIDDLASLLPDPPTWLATVPARRPAWVKDEMTARHAKAYVGAGMLAELLAHRILKRARTRSPIPIVLNGAIVGSGLVGRESVSIDISYAGDPLDVRHLRVGFGAYQTHRFRPDIIAHRGASQRPPFIAVPRGGQTMARLISHGRSLRHAARAARSRSAVLPIVTDGVRRLVAAYRLSSLGRFHRSFYGTPFGGGVDGDGVFRSLRLSALPDCVARPLLAPNDLLLQPAVIQQVTRALMADGMGPRDIAALVHSRYAADFGWGQRWQWLDAQTRAEFDVRVFAGMLATGMDQAIDFNCRSAQEKGLCPGGQCGRDLRVDRARLLRAVGR